MQPREEFIEFAEMLAGQSGTLHMRLLRGPKANEESEEYNVSMAVVRDPAFYAGLVEKNNEGWGIFTQVSEVEGQEKEPVATRVLWADLDFKGYPGGKEQALTLIRRVTPPSMIVRSGHGFHLYWKLNAPISPAEASIYTRGLLWQLGADAVQNANRIMRAPGFNNVKDMANPVPVVIAHNSEKRYTPGQIRRDSTIEKLPHGVMKKVVIQPYDDSIDRSAYDFRVAAELFRNGLNPEEVRDLFNRYDVSGKAASEGAGKARHINRTVAHAQLAAEPTQSKQREDVANPDVKLFTIAELLETFQPAFVIDDLLPEPGVLIVAAPSKARKSFFAIQLGLALAEGTQFLDFNIPTPRKTLYLQAELAPFMVGERFKGLLGDRPKPENLMVANVPAADLTDHADWLIDLVQENGFEVVIVDPIAKFIAGDENSSSSVGKFFSNLGRLRAMGVSVILVHHAKKLAEGQETTANSMRGSNRFFADVDAAILLTSYGMSTLVKYELRAAAPRSDETIYTHPDGSFQLEPYINPHLIADMEEREAERARINKAKLDLLSVPADLDKPEDSPTLAVKGDSDEARTESILRVDSDKPRSKGNQAARKPTS